MFMLLQAGLRGGGDAQQVEAPERSKTLGELFHELAHEPQDSGVLVQIKQRLQDASAHDRSEALAQNAEIAAPLWRCAIISLRTSSADHTGHLVWLVVWLLRNGAVFDLSPADLDELGSAAERMPPLCAGAVLYVLRWTLTCDVGDPNHCERRPLSGRAAQLADVAKALQYYLAPPADAGDSATFYALAFVQAAAFWNQVLHLYDVSDLCAPPPITVESLDRLDLGSELRCAVVGRVAHVVRDAFSLRSWRPWMWPLPSQWLEKSAAFALELLEEAPGSFAPAFALSGLGKAIVHAAAGPDAALAAEALWVAPFFAARCLTMRVPDFGDACQGHVPSLGSRPPRAAGRPQRR